MSDRYARQIVLPEVGSEGQAKLAAASVLARSAGFWNEARPQRPTISSARIEAGISGPAPGSGGGAEPEENDGRLILLQPAKNIASAAAAERFAAMRALRVPFIQFPPKVPWLHPSRSQA